MKYGLIGEKLGHSFSKTIHGMLSDNPYELYELERDELEEFMRAKNFLGINVTVPYKEAVIPYLDSIDESAEKIGAVNTVIRRGGALTGYNTDFYGMKMLFAHANIDVCGKKAVILGSGGTSKTAFAVLRSLGAGEILRVGRTARDGVISYSELYEKHTDSEIIVNTTPVGMFPSISGAAIELSRFDNLHGVLDAVYNPLRSELVAAARARKINAEGGLYMLVAQAVKASEIFLDKQYPDGTLDKIYNHIKRDKENIVLIGMPASGKSTVGRILAKKTGRKLVDTDELIVERAKMQIKDIFASLGEDEFRKLESEVVAEVSANNSLIISTGGGAILKEENALNLKKNGKLYFIDRPLSRLIPTASRPLASDREAIEKRYAERYGIYCEVCDQRIDADCEANAVADKILESF